MARKTINKKEDGIQYIDSNRIITSFDPRVRLKLPLILLPLYLINYLLHKLTSQTKPKAKSLFINGRLGINIILPSLLLPNHIPGVIPGVITIKDITSCGLIATRFGVKEGVETITLWLIFGRLDIALA